MDDYAIEYCKASEGFGERDWKVGLYKEIDFKYINTKLRRLLPNNSIPSIE